MNIKLENEKDIYERYINYNLDIIQYKKKDFFVYMNNKIFNRLIMWLIYIKVKLYLMMVKSSYKTIFYKIVK